MKLVDLSVILNENTPVYPGDPKTKVKIVHPFSEFNYQDSYVSVGTHVGTHIDAPSHMVNNGKTLDRVSVDSFSGRGVYIKVDDEFSLGEVKKADIQEGDIVLFQTGMSDVYYQSDYYEKNPAMSEEIAEYLVAKKVKMVGVDMCSVDHEPFPAHRILLKNEVLIIENLTNLGSVNGTSFKVYALPINLQLDGAPARVIAEVE